MRVTGTETRSLLDWLSTGSSFHCLWQPLAGKYSGLFHLINSTYDSFIVPPYFGVVFFTARVLDATCIWAAALDGDLNKVRSLIRKGTDPNQTDNFGYTALHYSSRHGHVPVCRFLLENGADSNSQTHGGSTALHRAAYCGHLEVVKLLLEFGADPARTDSDRRTALHKAAEGGQRNMYHFLLHHYNTLEDMRDGRGLTAADLAPSELYHLTRSAARTTAA
ncbi:ankyrin repeat domain-containing protein 39 [Bombina bombina]|uniref:ankyrin repeat domain-containing protein 39 n=1 Tax=Bombina bombina TaxID=8345 RepID=UPI00235AB6E3|nr:ankyrin repeat domain-containing protein 39 [Bombina bombina]